MPTFGASNVALSSLTSSSGFSFVGPISETTATNSMTYGAWSGYSVSAAGDVDKDGCADVIVGAFQDSPSPSSGQRKFAGASYVIYGCQNLASLDLNSLSSLQGFSIIGSPNQNTFGTAGTACNLGCGDESGASVSAAGDVNKDGYADVIVGSWLASPSGRPGAGISYVIYGAPRSMLTNVDLGSLSSSRGFSIFGAAAGDESGASVSAAGDVNKDGYADVIIGAFNAASGKGVSYVVYGSTSAATIDLSTFATSTAHGFSITGATAGDYSGWSVGSAGDVDKDGYSDMLIGAPYASPNSQTQAGTSYVLYGGTGLANVNLASLSTRGFSIAGANAGDQSGYAVDTAGDVNADGYSDMLIGAPYATGGGTSAGVTYVLYGGTRATLTNVNLSSLSSSKGISILGVAASDLSGTAVSTAGDVNADGYSDFVIGAPGATNGAGKSYVVYGGTCLSNMALGSLTPAQGFSISGAVAGDASGTSVSGGGDINKDGYADVVVGAYLASPGSPSRANAGTSYVIYGSSGGSVTAQLLGTANGNLNTCNTNLNTCTGVTVPSLNGQITSLNNQVNSLNSQVSFLQTTQCASSGNIGSLPSGYYCTTSSQYTSLTNQVSSLNSQVSSLQTTQCASGANIGSLPAGYYCTTQNQYSGLTSQINSLTGQVTSLQAIQCGPNGQTGDLGNGYYCLTTNQENTLASEANKSTPFFSGGSFGIGIVVGAVVSALTTFMITKHFMRRPGVVHADPQGGLQLHPITTPWADQKV